jgi:hypothetical protein
LPIVECMSTSSGMEKLSGAIVIESRFIPHQNQQTIRQNNARFKVVVAGRRFGKTVFAINELINIAIEKPNSKVWYVAPTYRAAKEIAWKMLFEYLPKEFISKRNEVELSVDLIQGSEISLKGADNPESLKGVGLDFCVLDEYGQMKEECWDEAIRPMLVVSKGGAIFIGTPVGYNHFWKLFQKEKDDSDYKSFHFRTVDNLAIEGMVEEVEKARRETDPVRFSQEYEANFEALVGRPRFDSSILKALIEKSEKPIVGNLHFDGNSIDFKEEIGGLIEIYRFPTDETKGVIGVDISEGVGNDRSSASFLNYDTLTEDIVINTNKIDPSQFAIEVWKLGHYCNKALIACENNGPGLACIIPLRNGQKEYSPYKNIYFKEIFDEVSKKKTKKFGWHTDAKSKPIMIDKLAELIRENLISIPSVDTCRELSTYVIEEDGKMNAVEGCCDDRVVSLAIATMMYATRPTFVVPKYQPRADKVYGKV